MESEFSFEMSSERASGDIANDLAGLLEDYENNRLHSMNYYSDLVRIELMAFFNRIKREYTTFDRIQMWDTLEQLKVIKGQMKDVFTFFNDQGMHVFNFDYDEMLNYIHSVEITLRRQLLMNRKFIPKPRGPRGLCPDSLLFEGRMQFDRRNLYTAFEGYS